jgi:hypothetical protein
MPEAIEYRFYLLDENDHIIGVRVHAVAEERQVQPMARRILHSERDTVVAVEGWNRDRRICRVRRGQTDEALFVWRSALVVLRTC